MQIKLFINTYCKLVKLLATCSIIFIFLQCSNEQELQKAYSLGKFAYESKKFQEAKKQFNIVYEEDPNFQNVRIHLGKIYFFTDDSAKAYRMFEEEYKSNDNSINAQLWMVKSGLRIDKDADSLLIILEKILEIDDSNVEAWFLRGLLFEKKGKIDKAIECYLQVKLYETQLIMADIQLAKIYKKAGLDRSFIELKNKIIVLAKGRKLLQNEIESLLQ